MKPKLMIIAVTKSHFDRICHLYQIPQDQTVYVSEPRQLRGISPDNIIIFGDEWWRGKREQDVEEIEMMVKMHNEKRRKQNG